MDKQQYIEFLESILIEEGYTKVCSYCALVCHPIWATEEEKNPCCEICDEVGEK
jgi:hypothetical protein